jgi:outer membrane lipoprotein-sorting protein
MKLCSLLLIAALALPLPVYGAETPAQTAAFLPADEIATHQPTITRLENYLSGLTTIVSDFTQVAPDGSLTNGKFYLRRPGKMRWQYNPPTPMLIISDNKEMIFYDYELEQISHVPLDSTLIGFLAEKKIRFDNSVGVKAIEEKDNAIRITVAQREKYNEGSLMLEFSDNPLLLRNMVVTDAAGQITTVSLNNAQFGVKLNKELFVFRDPRQRRDHK